MREDAMITSPMKDEKKSKPVFVKKTGFDFFSV